jgi:dihydropyrimidinase
MIRASAASPGGLDRVRGARYRGAVSVEAVVGGTVVAPGPRPADVLISEGKVARLGAAGRTTGQRLDAAGCYVLPGGVDPHCHLMTQIRLATTAAARGGTTTALSFTNPDPGQGDLDCLLSRRAEVAQAGAVIDVGLHAMLYDHEHTTSAQLAAIRRAGAAAVKVFLAYPELGIMWSPKRLFELMTDTRRLGLLVQAHCESGPLIEALVSAAVRDRALNPGWPTVRAFCDTRPPEVEEQAIASALAVASLTGAACYLVHLSTAGAIELVRLARKRHRAPVFAEVCLHHLLLDDHWYAGADAGRYLVAPPLRRREDIEALWEAVADGTIDAVGSDHCQTRSAVSAELSAPGESCQYGIAGIGARLPLLLSEGLARGIPIGRLMQLLSENPARIFGHYPQKGALAPGSDADIVVFDPAGETVVGPDEFDDGTGPSVYAGGRQRGKIRAVLLRGQLIVADGKVVAEHGSGRYLPASPERGHLRALADWLPRPAGGPVARPYMGRLG